MPHRTDDEIDHTSAQDLVERVRAVVQALLHDGSEPAAISFALVYVATELGLVVAEDPVAVFPVVLSRVAQAASTRVSEPEAKSEGLVDSAPVPGRDTIH